MRPGFTQDLEVGFSLLGSARHEAAISAFRRAAVSAPGETIALYGVGFTELRRENWSDSARLLGWASIAARRDTPPRFITETLLARGVSLRAEGVSEGASRCLRKAAMIEPHNPQIHAGLARGLGSPAREKVAGWATIAQPGSAEYWNGLGLARVDGGDPSGAARAYRRALVLAPAHPHGWNNLAIADKHRDETRRAVQAFDRARIINPGDRDIMLNLGRNLLLTGNLARGWECLEAPWRWAGLQPRGGGFCLPVWDGKPLARGGLLLWSEEKIGEEIMFSTLLGDVARRAQAPITVFCNPRIAGLLEAAGPGVEIRGWHPGAPPPARIADFAACYPLEFVGRFARRAFTDFPVPKPALRRDGHRAPRRRSATPRVGIHWRSVNPLVGKQKSTSLLDWGPVLAVRDVHFVSLQYGTVATEIADARRRFGQDVEVPREVDQLVDMHGFTEQVAGLDLVISVSSTSAHVAGGLGLPTWVLLPRGAGLSWFWFEERSDSPWYPNCRLYRQDEVGKWDSVLERIGRDLSRWREARRE